MDVFNPGQVFACLGILEALEVLAGPVEGGFDWSDPADVRFRLRGGCDDPVGEVLSFLTEAEVRVLVPESIPVELGKWGLSASPCSGPYPLAEPKADVLPVEFVRDGTCLRVDHWGDTSRRDRAKFWAGAGGYPAGALMRDALDLVRGRADEDASDPFAFAAPQSSNFRLDRRGSYVPLDAGFSLNKHANVVAVGYPWVEILATVGLSYARPTREAKLLYRYGIAGRAEGFSLEASYLPPPLLRLALGADDLGAFPQRTFRMHLDWPGKEGQARVVTTVSEESNP